jgi:hypothetical protein
MEPGASRWYVLARRSLGKLAVDKGGRRKTMAGNSTGFGEGGKKRTGKLSELDVSTKR